VKFAGVQLKGTPRNISKKQPARDGQKQTFDFSYSGIKTSVLRYAEVHEMQAEIQQRKETLAQIAKPSVEDVLKVTGKATLDLVASFQRVMVEDLASKTVAAIRETNAATLFVTAGWRLTARSEQSRRASWHGRGAGLLSLKADVDRQCRHDRGGGVSEVFWRRNLPTRRSRRRLRCS